MIRTKPKICKQCGNKFTPMNSLQPVCGPRCAVAFNSKKEVNKRIKEMRKEVQSLGDLRFIARQTFQKWIRLRDAKEPCISCPSTESKQWDGGHYLKAEIYTGLIFDEMNVNKQCAYCNNHLQGNPVEYRKGMIKKYGLQAVEGLEAMADISRVYKFSKQELIDITIKYKEKIKAL